MKLQVDIRKKLRGPEGNMLLEMALTVPSGETLAIYGSSGAGKTTVLRLIAGLDRPDGGHIHANDTTWFDSGKRVNLSARKRMVGMVFQDYALFPNMTVRQHLDFAQSKPVASKIAALLDLSGLSHLADRKPQQLSGGQQQRLALARALAAEPQLLLLDEALSALDPEMRLQMQEAVLAAQQEFGLTIVLVSHDPGEVFRLAGQVAVLENGEIVRQGSPREVFAAKSSRKGLVIPVRILEIKPKADGFTIEIEAQGQIHSIYRETVGNWTVGESVWLSFDPATGEIEG
jgi:molybdate transport system ATP-binding protein